MVSDFHHGFRYQRRRAHTFERANGPGALLWTVHDGGVELDHAVGIRQTAITDAVVGRIELDDIYTCDHRVEHIRTAGDHRERLHHRRHVPAILKPVPVSGRDYKRLNDTLLQDHRKTDPRNSPTGHEVTALYFGHVVLVL